MVHIVFAVLFAASAAANVPEPQMDGFRLGENRANGGMTKQLIAVAIGSNDACTNADKTALSGFDMQQVIKQLNDCNFRGFAAKNYYRNRLHRCEFHDNFFRRCLSYSFGIQWECSKCLPKGSQNQTELEEKIIECTGPIASVIEGTSSAAAIGFDVLGVETLVETSAAEELDVALTEQLTAVAAGSKKCNQEDKTALSGLDVQAVRKQLYTCTESQRYLVNDPYCLAYSSRTSKYRPCLSQTLAISKSCSKCLPKYDYAEENQKKMDAQIIKCTGLSASMVEETLPAASVAAIGFEPSMGNSRPNLSLETAAAIDFESLISGHGLEESFFV